MEQALRGHQKIDRRSLALHRAIADKVRLHPDAVAKCVAGRDKDRSFTKALARHGMIDRDLLLARVSSTTLTPKLRELVLARIEADFGNPAGSESSP